MYQKKVKVDYTPKIAELEKDSWVILYKKYRSLPAEDYARLLDEWDIYYHIVREESPMYKLYQESKNAWLKRDFVTVKKNALIAKDWLINGKRINSPSEEDPRVIIRRSPVQTYINVISANSSTESKFDL